MPLKGSDSVPLARQDLCPHAGPAASPSPPLAPGKCVSSWLCPGGHLCLPLCSWSQRPTRGSQKASQQDLRKARTAEFRAGAGGSLGQMPKPPLSPATAAAVYFGRASTPETQGHGHSSSPDFLPACPLHTQGNEQIPGSCPDDEREGPRPTGQAGPRVLLLLRPTSSPPGKSRGSVSRTHPEGSRALSPGPHACVSCLASGPGAPFPRSPPPSTLTREPDTHTTGRLSQPSPRPTDAAQGPQAALDGQTERLQLPRACGGGTTQPGTGKEL